MNTKLSTQPYKGARDWYPGEMRLRNYIFDTWKRVCRLYGFEEYDFPILEPWEIFAAKTGEEIMNEQLFSFEDKGGRKLAIRPELTPGTVRMLAGEYGELVCPVKWFMIGNNWRYEKPQKGRGREFFQLEVNTFGVPGVLADFEIFSVMIDVMKAFGADEKMFQISFSDRRLITALLNDLLKLDDKQQIEVKRLMDKRLKMQKEKFMGGLNDLGLKENQAVKVEDFMQSNIFGLKSVVPKEILDENEGYQSILQLIKLLEESKLDKYCRFNPSIIRGFDYSDGLVYEVFDLNPENNRSMFGGERFDELIKIFNDKYELEATGFAMGDVTLVEFLKGWNLLPDLESEVKVMVATTDTELCLNSFEIGQKLREAGINTNWYHDVEVKLDKQLKYANRKGIPWVVIVGPEEVEAGKVGLKNMKSGKQEMVTVEDAIKKLT